MLKPTLMTLLTALFAGNAMADTVEFCPNPSEISNVGGVLTAKTESGKGEWLGLLNEPKASITTFDNAIFYSSNDKVSGVGHLRACTYKTTGKQTVDIRYRPEVTPDVAIRVVHTPAWKEMNGPFGITYFQCSVQDLQGCAFREAE